MSAIEQAIEAMFDELGSIVIMDHEIEAILNHAVESKYLIPADDTEALIAALGLTQVGVMVDEYGNGPNMFSYALDDGVPVYRLKDKP